MALNFPTNPTLNQVYTDGNYSFLWDGNSWVAGGSIASATVFDNKIDAAFIQANSSFIHANAAYNAANSAANNISAGSITGDKLGLTSINANNIVNGGVTVAKGGTGLSTLTANSVVLGNGTDPVQLIAPGTTGNVLTSNGTNWTSQAAAAGGGNYAMQVFVGPSTGTWTKPAGLKAIKVTVIGGGGSSGSASYSGGGGSGGGSSIEYIDAPAIPGPQPYTAGGGGAAPSPTGQGAAGGTSSFGSPAFLSATGGTGVYPASPTITSINSGGVGSGGQLNIGGGMGARFNLTCFGYLLHSGGSILGTTGALVGGGFSPTSGFTGSDRGYGAGSFGHSPSPGAGIAGGPGVVIIEEFY